MHAAEVAHAAAAVDGRVAVEELAPVARHRAGHAQRHARLGCHVADGHRQRIAGAAAPHEGQDRAVRAARTGSQLKPSPSKSLTCSAGTGGRRVEVGHPARHAGVQGPRPQVPVERALVVPLLQLAELAAHEQQLLARVRPHVAVQVAQAREALPLVAGLLAQQAALAVHHLVVRERQDEVLVKA
jgi:hypothetical protein